MNKRVKIAIVTTMAESPWGGSEELWSSMAALAIKDGHEVMALIPAWRPRHSKVQDLVDSGMKVAEWGEFHMTKEQNNQAGRPVWYPYHSVLEFMPDIVFVSHGGFMDCVNGHVLFVQMLLENNIRFMLIIQANTDLYFPNDAQRNIMQIYYSHAVEILFAARKNLEIARRQLAIPLENGGVFYSPISLSSNDYVPWPESDTALMASVARLDAFPKGQDLLLEVLKQNKWRNRDWILNFFGVGIHKNYFRELVRYFQLEDRINILGKNEDMRKIWADHQLLLLPSRIEGTPIVLFGAMLCGRPSVVTDVGGNADWILHRENGFVAEAATIHHIDRALDQAWKARQYWREIGMVARESFLKRHEIHSGITLLNKLVCNRAI